MFVIIAPLYKRIGMIAFVAKATSGTFEVITGIDLFTNVCVQVICMLYYLTMQNHQTAPFYHWKQILHIPYMPVHASGTFVSV
jgi:hypothetical protein